MRDDTDSEIFMSGLVVTVVKTMIVTVTDMPLLCGQFPSIPPLTLVRMPITMNLVPLHLHQHSPMVLRILTLGLLPPIYMGNVQEHILEPQLLHQKPQEYLHSHLMLIVS